MRLLKSILAVMAMAVTLSLASCSSSDGDGPDDPNNPDETLESIIIGVWEHRYNSYEQYYYAFYADGTCDYIEFNDDYAYPNRGHYSLSDRTLSVQLNNSIPLTYEVKSFSRNKIVVKSEDGTETFNRIDKLPEIDNPGDNNPYKQAIQGSWLYKYSENEAVSYTFRDDYTYTQVSYEYDEPHFACEGSYTLDNMHLSMQSIGDTEWYYIQDYSDRELTVYFEKMLITLNRFDSTINPYEKLVIGKWKYETESQTEIMSVNADGTFSINTTVAGQEGERLTTGTWTINHNAVTLHITHDSGEYADIYSYLSINSIGVEYIGYRLIDDTNEERFADRI